MSDKSVLFVGLSAEQIAELSVPSGAEVTSVAAADQAIDRVALAPPDLIVANEHIGEIDSLDFFGRLTEAAPHCFAPIIFLAAPGSGVQPFAYQKRRAGFEVRYVDAEGELRTFFVTEPSTDRTFSVRTIRPGQLADEIVRTLESGVVEPAEGADADWNERVWEVGFNQDVSCAGGMYHVQTEVVGAEPVTVATTVFRDGHAVHVEQHKVKGEQASLAGLRRHVEALHSAVVARVGAGELGS